MKATLFSLIALAVGIAAGFGWTRQEFSREVLPVDVSAVVKTTSGTKAAPKIGPKVTIVNGERHDFGSMDRNAHGKHAYLVRNDGDAPLELSTGSPSCGVCIKVFTVSNPVLQPGERTEVKIEWDVKTSDEEFEQSGPLNTNDPNRKSVHLSIHGHVIDNVRPDRPDVHFSDLSPSESATASVNIFAYRDGDLKVEKHELAKLASADFLEVSFGPLSTEDLAKEPRAKGGVKMTIDVKAGKTKGQFDDTISVTTNQSVEPLTVRVIGNVATDVLLMGPNVNREQSVVNLGAFSQKEGKKHTIFLIVKGPHRDDTKVEIESIEPKHDFSAKLGEPVRDTPKTIRYPIVIEVPAGATPVTRTSGSYAMITVKTTHPEVKEVGVKVRYVVKE